MPKATRKSNLVSNTHPSEGQAMFNNNEGQEEFNNEQETVSENESPEDCNNLNESQEILMQHMNQALTKKLCLILNLQQAERCIIPEVDQCIYQLNNKHTCHT